MKSFLLAMLAIVAMFVAVPSVEAHGGARAFRAANGDVIVVDGFGNVIARRGGHVAPRGFVPRGNVNPFNQNGGRNRFGFRR